MILRRIAIFGLILMSLSQCGKQIEPPAIKEQALKNFQNIPLYFQENQGQTDEVVKFLTKTSQTTTFFTPKEVVYKSQMADKSLVIRQSFLEANKSPQIVGEKEQEAKVNYFIGNDSSKWKNDIPTFAQIRYKEIYPGIDVVFSGTQKEHTYEYIITPKGMYEKIQVKLEGIDDIYIDSKGVLVLSTEAGNIGVKKALFYQDIKGQRKELSGSYNILSNDTYGFMVEGYDRDFPLIIKN